MHDAAKKNDLRPVSSQGDRSQGQRQQRQGGGFGNCADGGNCANTRTVTGLRRRNRSGAILLQLGEKRVVPVDVAVHVEVASIAIAIAVDDKIVKSDVRLAAIAGNALPLQEGKSVGAEAAGVFQRD